MSLIGEAEVCFDELGLRCTWCIRQGWGLLVCWWTVQAPTTWIAGGSSPGAWVSHLTALLCLSVSVAFWLPLWGHSDHLASGHQMTFGSLAFWKSPEG